MKSSLVLISAIAAATAGFGVSGYAVASPSDAQAQAAALLSPTYESASADVRSQETASSRSVALDAHAHAAAVLSGVRPDREDSVQVTRSTTSPASGDAQAQAAALLSNSRSASVEVTRTTATREKLGSHPAVIVAEAWKNRGIDPNTFIVAHPARLQLFATSPSEDETQLAQAEKATSVTVGGVRSGLND
jgi:hypothetical protein